MNEHDDQRLDPELERIRRAIRNLPRVDPDPTYQAQVRRAFLEDSPAADPVVPVRPRFRWPDWLRFSLVPATVVAILLVLFIANRGPDWSIHRAYGDGAITIDGTSVAIDRIESAEPLLRAQESVRLGEEAGLEIRCGDLLVVEAVPGTEFTMPGRPGRWSDRSMRLHVENGEVRVLSGEEFAGHSLDLITPEGRTVLTGTIVSVFRNPELTCVCVLEGEAMIGEDAETMEPIPAGMRKVMFQDDRPALVTEIAPDHLTGLEEFAARNRDVFDP
ncbi:MAG: hypothetical protein GF346_04565 [Candidatus Eisenbacteria bacterium]|nr:hypothetical protein [Candidatus Latescibacterota bacterium]MBD3301700.1 hypothetical protein [Candidatus Eisenbacteria bacterium]